MTTVSASPACTKHIQAVQAFRKAFSMSQNLSNALISKHDSQHDLAGPMEAPLRSHKRPCYTVLCLLAPDMADPRRADATQVVGTSGADTGMPSSGAFSTSACALVDFAHVRLALSMSASFHFASMAFSTEWSDLRKSNEYSFITYILVYFHSESAGAMLWGERGARGATCVEDAIAAKPFHQPAGPKIGVSVLLESSPTSFGSAACAMMGVRRRFSGRNHW